jgi:D-glycero-alpha-D-manno-heptose-7-phosphate kinase
VTVNFALDCFTRCWIRPVPGGKIELKSADLTHSERYDSLDKAIASRDTKLRIHVWVLRHFAPWLRGAGGFQLETLSESPAGAGISGSSSLLITVVSAFNRLCATKYSREKIREVAQNIEAQVIRVPTGAQDYYPALYGGVSAIELGVAGIVRKEIPLPHEELNQRFVLAYTGEPRNSGINNWEVTKAYIDGNKAVHRNFDRISEIAQSMRKALEAGAWNEVARLLREEWRFRRTNAPGITTPLIDRLIAVTRPKGARGAKVCGAGGGGCVLFLVERGAKDRVAAAIANEGANVLPVKVAPHGVRVHTSG